LFLSLTLLARRFLLCGDLLLTALFVSRRLAARYVVAVRHAKALFLADDALDLSLLQCGSFLAKAFTALPLAVVLMNPLRPSALRLADAVLLVA